ncbi:beta-1,3-glucan-binding protein isoform X2 [Aplysia californica]|uniref:Beta-1,3-glucan-binding protein isoform X2 n=1 Tax=Aplysia californica TaxID=6500 RepID=A0ABM1VWS9_APLCA|nr:beta-1,3-glucan-binding protein isoform X2 [Aplysia californica]
MLRSVVFTLLLLCHVEGASRVLLSLGYVGDSIQLSLKLTGSDAPAARDVTFMYSINGRESTGRAAPVGDEWQYEITLAERSGRFLVSAFAIYNIGGVPHTTAISRADATLNNGVTERRTAPKIPSRQIRGAVVFRDDFNSWNTHNWVPEVSMYGGYSGQFQAYTNDRKNVFTEHGLLYIQPTLTTDDHRFTEASLHTGVMDMQALYGTCTNHANSGCHREGKDGLLPPVMSGRINSVPTLKFGTVEVRARIPRGDWLHPAIWMRPRDDKYGHWPRSGEIDIMESRGNLGYFGIETLLSALHWGPSSDQDGSSKTSTHKRSSNWHSEYHTWKLEWTPTHMLFFVDNQEIMKIDPGSSFWHLGGFHGHNIWSSGGKMAPFDQEFAMTLNVAVGGTNGIWSDTANYPTTKPWKNDSPTAMEDFWNARSKWHPTWRGRETAFIVDYVEFKSL